MSQRSESRRILTDGIFGSHNQPQEAGEGLGCLVVPAPMTPEEAIAEGEKANAEVRARREARLQSKP